MRSQNVIPSLFLDFMQMQQFAKNPLVFAEGKGIHLTDSEGKRYIDGLSGVFVTSLYGSAVVAGYLMGWIATHAGWTTAGEIQISLLSIVAGGLALALQPQRMSL